MKKKLIAAALILGLLAGGSSASAHSAGHSACEYPNGSFPYGHSIVSDLHAPGWGHRANVSSSASSGFIITKFHYYRSGPPPSYWVYAHSSATANCP